MVVPREMQILTMSEMTAGAASPSDRLVAEAVTGVLLPHLPVAQVVVVLRVFGITSLPT